MVVHRTAHWWRGGTGAGAAGGGGGDGDGGWWVGEVCVGGVGAGRMGMERQGGGAEHTLGRRQSRVGVHLA